MLTFKGFLTRWMASSAKLAPFLQANVTTLLNTNAKAAIAQCSGGKNGRMCGFQWNKFAAWDGTTGAGQQMAALNVVTNTLAKDAGVVLTNKTGGTSQGNPNAGGGGSSSIETPRIITTGDRVGAGIMTTVILIGAIGGMWWMALE
jgi:mannan endo-1,6-alpha-mannosidase